MRDRRPNKLNSPQLKKLNERLMARRMTRETLEQIAADFGVSPQTIRYHEKKLPPPIRYKPVPLDEDEVLRLYGIHMSQAAVGRVLGVSEDRVSRILARAEQRAAA